MIQSGKGISSVIIVLIMALGFGAVSGIMIAFLNRAPFIATLAMTTILKGAAYMYQTGQSRRIDGTFLPNWVKDTTFGIPNPVLVMIIVYFVFLFILNRTRFGRGIYAIGGNRQTAELAGINVRDIWWPPMHWEDCASQLREYCSAGVLEWARLR